MLNDSVYACREVLRLAFEGKIKPMVGNALFSEYESVPAEQRGISVNKLMEELATMAIAPNLMSKIAFD